jgi:hypothetical protein
MKFDIQATFISKASAREVFAVCQESGDSLQSRKPGNLIIYFPNVTLSL